MQLSLGHTKISLHGISVEVYKSTIIYYAEDL